MGFLRRLLGGGGGSAPRDEGGISQIYVQCRRCGEPLKGRIDMRNEPSLDDNDNWVVRKGLMGSGENYCFQTVEVILTFDPQKKSIIDSEVIGGTLLTAEEYAAVVQQREQEREEQQGEEE